MPKPTLADIARQNRTKDAARFKAPSATAALEPVPGARWRIEWWPVAQVDDNPFQTRSTYDNDHIENLKTSMNKDGMRQLGEARLHPDNKKFPDQPPRVQLVFAHCRKRAIEAGGNAGAVEENPDDFVGLIPLRVYDYLTPVQMLRRAIEENDTRLNISPLDRARSLKNLQKLVTEELKAAGGALDEDFPDTTGELDLELEGEAPDDQNDEEKLASWRIVARESGDPKRWRQMQRTANLLRLPAEVRDLLDKKMVNERQCRGLVSMLKTPAEAGIVTLANSAVRLRLTGEMVDNLARAAIEKATGAGEVPDLAQLADEAKEEEKKKKAGKAKAENKAALEAGKSHLSLVPPVAPQDSTGPGGGRLIAVAGEDGQLKGLAVPNPASGDETGKARWASAIIEGRIQPAALALDGARESFVLAEFGPRERKKLLASIEHLEEILAKAKEAL